MSCMPTGENVKPFFSRVAALAFEQSVLQDLERRSSARRQVGDEDLIRAYWQEGCSWGADAFSNPCPSSPHCLKTSNIFNIVPSPITLILGFHFP